MKEGYKKTLAGNIPVEWGVEKLENLTDKITDGTHKTPTYTECGIPFLRVTDIQSRKIDLNNVKYISKEEHIELLKRCNPEIGDILYSKNGTIGIPKIVDWDFDFSIFVSLCLIKIKKCNSEINTEFLEQYLKSDSCFRQIRLRSKQGTVTNLHLEEIRELMIPLPSIEEQQKIAEILSTVDSQIDDTDKLIEKTKELKKGLMQQLLMKGIGHKEFKKTEIGEIPVEWEVKDINSCASVTKLAGFEFTEYISYIEDGEIIALRALNLKKGKLNLNDIKRIDKKVSDSLLRSKLFIGDLLFSYVGTVGEIALINENDKFHLAPNVAKIRFNDNILPEYALQYMMSSKLKNEISKYVTTTSQPALSMENIRKIRFVVPTLAEQKKITNILSSVDTEIQEYENKKAKLEDFKKGLMQQLLSGKVRVV